MSDDGIASMSPCACCVCVAGKAGLRKGPDLDLCQFNQEKNKGKKGRESRTVLLRDNSVYGLPSGQQVLQ